MKNNNIHKINFKWQEGFSMESSDNKTTKIVVIGISIIGTLYGVASVLNAVAAILKLIK